MPSQSLSPAASAAKVKAAASKLRKAEKKVWFFLCWANDACDNADHATLRAARHEVRLFRASIDRQLSDAAAMSAPDRQQQVGGERRREATGGSTERGPREVQPLIQELS
jgi:hypothetical protein